MRGKILTDWSSLNAKVYSHFPVDRHAHRLAIPNRLVVVIFAARSHDGLSISRFAIKNLLGNPLDENRGYF